MVSERERDGAREGVREGGPGYAGGGGGGGGGFDGYAKIAMVTLCLDDRNGSDYRKR